MLTLRKVKLVLVGRNGVGKTSLAMRFTRNVFAHRYIATIGCDYYMKTMVADGVEYKLVIHDIGGQVEFENLRKKHVENADIAIVTFAVDNPDTYDVNEFLRDYDDFERKPLVALAGNKMDLVDPATVDLHVPEGIARASGATLFTVSAKENTGVRELFTGMLERFAGTAVRELA